VIAQQARATVSFVLHRGRREGESILVSYQVVGQDSPEAVLDELSHFLSEELGMIVGGLVASLVEAFVFGFEGPRLGLRVGRDAFVPPLLQQLDSWVVHLFQFGG
jgi:hypothetical protein